MVNLLFNQTTVLGLYLILTLRFRRLITDWLVKNLNPDMTPSGISFDVSFSPLKNKSEKRYSNQLIFNKVDTDTD